MHSVWLCEARNYTLSIAVFVYLISLLIFILIFYFYSQKMLKGLLNRIQKIRRLQ